MIFFYRRIFRGKTFSILSWIMVGVIVAWTLGGFFAIAFQCGPHISILWSSLAAMARSCTTGLDIVLGFAIPDVITDILILVLPLYWVCSSGWLSDIAADLLHRHGNLTCQAPGELRCVGCSSLVSCMEPCGNRCTERH